MNLEWPLNVWLINEYCWVPVLSMTANEIANFKDFFRNSNLFEVKINSNTNIRKRKND
jgi:hypothetical protein